MWHFPSSGLFLKEERLFLFFDAFSDILINPDTPKSHIPLQTRAVMISLLFLFHHVTIAPSSAQRIWIVVMGKPSSFLTFLSTVFFKFTMNPAGFYHVHPSQQHEGHPSGWGYYCNTSLTSLAPACQQTCQTQHHPAAHGCSLHSRCFPGASSPWLSGFCCFQFWGVSGTCCSVTCSPCLLSDIRLNQFQDVILHESQHASAHSMLGCLFLMPISPEGSSRCTPSIHFHQFYPDPLGSWEVWSLFQLLQLMDSTLENHSHQRSLHSSSHLFYM